jgi:hypothetical protein
VNNCISSIRLVHCSNAEITKDLSQHGGIVLAKSKQHQEAHGIGQIEQQLNDQMEAAEEIQGQSKLDRDIQKASHRQADPLKDLSK